MISDRAPDRMRKFNLHWHSLCYLLNPIFDHLSESSLRDDSNKWLNMGFGEEIGILELKLPILSRAL